MAEEKDKNINLIDTKHKDYKEKMERERVAELESKNLLNVIGEDLKKSSPYSDLAVIKLDHISDTADKIFKTIDKNGKSIDNQEYISRDQWEKQNAQVFEKIISNITKSIFNESFFSRIFEQYESTRVPLIEQKEPEVAPIDDIEDQEEEKKKITTIGKILTSLKRFEEKTTGHFKTFYTNLFSTFKDRNKELFIIFDLIYNNPLTKKLLSGVGSLVGFSKNMLIGMKNMIFGFSSFTKTLVFTLSKLSFTLVNRIFKSTTRLLFGFAKSLDKLSSKILPGIYSGAKSIVVGVGSSFMKIGLLIIKSIKKLGGGIGGMFLGLGRSLLGGLKKILPIAGLKKLFSGNLGKSLIAGLGKLLPKSFKNLLGGFSKVASKGLGKLIPGLGALLSAGAGWKKIQDIKNDQSLSEEERNKKVREAKFETGGSIAGATIGGVVGTIFGGPIGTVIGGMLGDFIGGFVGKVLALFDFGKIWKGIKSFGSTVWNGLTDMAGKALLWLAKMIPKIPLMLVKGAWGLMKMLWRGLTGAFEMIKEGIATLGPKILPALGYIVEAAWEGLKKLGATFMDSVMEQVDEILIWFDSVLRFKQETWFGTIEFGGLSDELVEGAKKRIEERQRKALEEERELLEAKEKQLAAEKERMGVEDEIQVTRDMLTYGKAYEIGDENKPQGAIDIKIGNGKNAIYYDGETKQVLPALNNEPIQLSGPINQKSAELSSAYFDVEAIQNSPREVIINQNSNVVNNAITKNPPKIRYFISNNLDNTNNGYNTNATV